MNQEKLMKQVQPGALHVLVVARIQDGAVGLFYTRDPLQWLASIGSHMQLGKTEVRPSAAAAKVVEALRQRFAMLHMPSDALPWYQVDYAQALEALNAIDLATGEPLHDLLIGNSVFVMPARIRGRVFGFTRGGSIVVKLDDAPNVANLLIARRENLKPVLRAKACTGGAS